MRRFLPLACLIIVPTFLPSVARADSGGATIKALPDSYMLEGHVEVHHECGGVFQSEREKCFWYGEASQYPANVECPFVYDGSHSVWVGSAEQGSGASSGSFSFIPEANTVILCLYVDESREESLVGKSHPFDTQTGNEVLPRPSGRYPSRTSVYLTIHGCEIKPHILVNGSSESIGGRSVWTLMRGSHEHIGGSISASNEFNPYTEPPGRYRFSARFLGTPTCCPRPRRQASPSASSTANCRHRVESLITTRRGKHQ
jgi:hypothetical protein